MSLKRLYHRFREWQRNPHEYKEIGSEMHCCCNCGQEYTGGFCPRCGQRVTASRITWDVVRQGVMDVWGLGGRSLPYSLWQLLWRPGYFIGDYINGKRQSSFPPVKMLVLVTVALYFIGKVIFPEYWNTLLEYDSSSITSTGWQYYVDYVSQWIGNHIEWLFLFIFSLLILPTWLVFRHSPRNPRHTIPQGFFMQVFMTIQFFLWVFVISSCVKLSGVNLGYAAGSEGFDDVVYGGSLLMIPIIVTVNYKQLFGYGWWGTVWRGLMSIVTPLFFLTGLYLLFGVATHLFSSNLDVYGREFKVSLLGLFFILFTGLLLSFADVINRRLWRERGWLRAWAIPLLIVLMLIGLSVALEKLQDGILMRILEF